MVLHHYLGLPLAEIAVTLGVPLGGLKGRGGTHDPLAWNAA